METWMLFVLWKKSYIATKLPCMRTKPGWLKFHTQFERFMTQNMSKCTLRNFEFRKCVWRIVFEAQNYISFLTLFGLIFWWPLASKSMVRRFMQMPRVCHLAGPFKVRTLERWAMGRWSCSIHHKSTMILWYMKCINAFFPNTSCSSCSLCSYLLALHCSWFFLPHGSQSRIFLQHPFQILVELHKIYTHGHLSLQCFLRYLHAANCYVLQTVGPISEKRTLTITFRGKPSAQNRSISSRNHVGVTILLSYANASPRHNNQSFGVCFTSSRPLFHHL